MTPSVNPECVPHSFACACREARFKAMEEQNERLREAIDGAMLSLENTLQRLAKARALLEETDG